MLRKTLYATDGETIQVAEQWAAECEKRGTTITDSAWAVDGGALAGEALTGTLATVLLTPTGNGTLTNTVSLANGETLIASRRVEVGGTCLTDYL